jgi:hypothetical protein
MYVLTKEIILLYVIIEHWTYVQAYGEVKICTSDDMCLLASLSWRDLMV